MKSEFLEAFLKSLAKRMPPEGVEKIEYILRRESGITDPTESVTAMDSALSSWRRRPDRDGKRPAMDSKSTSGFASRFPSAARIQQAYGN